VLYKDVWSNTRLMRQVEGDIAVRRCKVFYCFYTLSLGFRLLWSKRTITRVRGNSLLYDKRDATLMEPDGGGGGGREGDVYTTVTSASTINDTNLRS
jgi:hypothetical protein